MFDNITTSMTLGIPLGGRREKCGENRQEKTMVDKEELIEKAVEWLDENLDDYQQFWFWDKFTETHELDKDKLIEFFKNAMEE